MPSCMHARVGSNVLEAIRLFSHAEGLGCPVEELTGSGTEPGCCMSALTQTRKMESAMH